MTYAAIVIGLYVIALVAVMLLLYGIGKFVFGKLGRIILLVLIVATIVGFLAMVR